MKRGLVHARTGRAAVLALLVCACGDDPRGEIPAGERQRMPGTIAFVSERDGQKDVWLLSPTGMEQRLTHGAEDEFPASPAPDGRALLIVAAWQDGPLHLEQLRLVPLGGGETHALHAPRARARNPSWAPDGTWLVAESDERGFSDIVRTTPEGDAQPVWLAAAPQGNFEPSVSPDGAEIAFVSSREGDPEVYVMSADGQTVRRLTTFHKEDWGPRWSPDGRFIAFLSNREGRDRVFVVHPDGSGVRAISGNAATGNEREPAWSPDGRTLAFVGRQDDGTTRIFAVAVDGGEPMALTGGKSLDDQPAWSPDGAYIVFVSERAGDPDLFLMRADGTGHTRLTRTRGADWLPRWFAAR